MTQCCGCEAAPLLLQVTSLSAPGKAWFRLVSHWRTSYSAICLALQWLLQLGASLIVIWVCLVTVVPVAAKPGDWLALPQKPRCVYMALAKLLACMAATVRDCAVLLALSAATSKPLVPRMPSAITNTATRTSINEKPVLTRPDRRPC